VVYHRPELLAESDYTIVTHYQQTYRGIVQYYLPAHNVKALGKLRWIMEASLLKTLAQKHKRTVSAMWKKYAATTQTPDGPPLKCLEVRVERANRPPLIARFGGISLARQPFAILNDCIAYPVVKTRKPLVLREIPFLLQNRLLRVSDNRALDGRARDCRTENSA